MKSKEDYYIYWNRERKKETKILNREKNSLKEISKFLKTGNVILDAGCGNGRFMHLIKKRFPKATVKGVDYSQSEVAEARTKGLDVIQGDLEDSTAFKQNFFDMVYAGEVIEHLYNPDAFLMELNRISKLQGYVIITTPNLCAWFNRIFMLMGIQPLFLESSTKSKLIGAGVLKKFKKESQPVGHVRIFNIDAIKDLLNENGFRVMKIKGNITEQTLPNWLLPFDRIFSSFPSLSSNLIVVAKKVKDLK